MAMDGPVIDPAKIGHPGQPGHDPIPTAGRQRLHRGQPDERRVYVTDSGNINGSLVEVNGTCAEHKLVTVGSRTLPAGPGCPPLGELLYVANSDGTVSVIDTAKIGTPDNRSSTPCRLVRLPLGLPSASRSRRTSVYATNQGEETVEIIAALPPNQFIASVPVGIGSVRRGIDPTQGRSSSSANSGAGACR